MEPLPGIVWVTPSLSAEARSGGEIRTHRLLAALNQVADVELVVLGPRSSLEAIRSSTGCSEVKGFPSESSAVRKRARALLRGWPLPTAGWWSAAARDAVFTSAAHGKAVVLDQLWCASFLPNDVPLVLHVHNAETHRLRQEPPPDRLIHRIEALWNIRATCRLERRAVRRADLVVTVSELDASLMGVMSLVVPNGADLPPDPGIRPHGGDVLFVGSMDYPPNERAVRWWADEVWPRLSGGVPPLSVVGRSTHEVLADLLQHPSVRLFGEVDDLAVRMRAASVVAVPLQQGGGTRLKILEAMAWNRPIVSTSKGAEGLPVTDGQQLLLADDPRHFADAVAQIYMDGVLADKLARGGADLVQTLAWDHLTEPFARAVTRLGVA